jgi:hypothetical protein
MRARLATFLVLGLTSACASEATEIAFRDPWQIALVRVARSGERSHLLDAGQHDHGLAWRDERGAPHFEMRADYAWRDGRLVNEEAPIVGAREVRVPVRVYERGWCWRPVHACWSWRGWVELVTPRSNLARVVPGHQRARE